MYLVEWITSYHFNNFIYYSVMETIGNVIYALRHYWDCFKYNICYKENLPEICYNFFDEKPEIYQTRNMYPKIDTSSFDIILNNIITGIQCYIF